MYGIKIIHFLLNSISIFKQYIMKRDNKCKYLSAVMFRLGFKTKYRWNDTSMVLCQKRRIAMCLLPDTQNWGLRMRRECQERFPRHWHQSKPLVSDPGMHHSMCVTHVPWCMSGSLTLGRGENVPGIPGACATRNFAYLVWGPWIVKFRITFLSGKILFIAHGIDETWSIKSRMLCTYQNEFGPD